MIRWLTIAVLACTSGCALVESVVRPARRTDAVEASPTAAKAPLQLALVQFPSGQPWTLEVDRGHPVLLDVWATWCEPCRDALPVYQALQRRFADRGLRVYAVNVDEDPSLVTSVLDELKVTLPVLRDPSARTLEQALRLQIVPTSYVIDAAGVVQHVHEGFADDAQATVAREVEALLAPH